MFADSTMNLVDTTGTILTSRGCLTPDDSTGIYGACRVYILHIYHGAWNRRVGDTHGPGESGTRNNGIRETCNIIGNVTTSDFKQRGGGEFVNMALEHFGWRCRRYLVNSLLGCMKDSI